MKVQVHVEGACHMPSKTSDSNPTPADPPPPASRVERLTSRGAKMDVEVRRRHGRRLRKPRSEVLGSGYSVAASSRGAGDWNFLVVGYDDDGALLEAGRAHVTLSDILLPRMTKVGTEALQSLKVETGEMDVKVNGFLCPASKVCYDLEPENILEPPEVCRMAAPNIEQCDMTAAYIQPESLIERSVQLSFTGVPEEDLMITADFSETSLTMEAKLYTSSEDLTPNPLTCEITGRSPKTCTFKVEPKVTEFKILLMALDSASTVDESTVVEFEDFQTRIQQLTSDAIEVRWRASHNQKYDVEIAPEIEGKFSNTSVICGGENPEDSKMCLAYFIGLNLNEDYTASVRAQGDNKYVSASVRMQTVLEKMKPRVVVPLTIKELQKVSREDDPSGRQQNMRVFLDPHEAKDADDFQLSLILASGTGQEAHLLYKIIDGDATEIEFKGNFQDSGCHYKCYERRGYCGIWLRGAGIDRPGFQGGEGWGRQRPVTEGGPRGARPGGSPWEASLRGRLWPLLLRRPERPTVPPLRDLPEIRFCDAVVSEAQNPTEVPALELRNRQELRVQQPRPDGARTEVVVSSDDSILPPDGFGCDDLGDGTCAHPVAVADDLDGFDVTLVVLDDQGYVTASLAVPFEVHGVATLSLSQDVLQVAVDPRSGGAYEVTLAGPSPPPAAAQECQLGSPCRVWFAGVDAPPAVSVRKGSNAIYEDISTDPPPPASRVQRLTSRGAKMDVEVASDNT
nr:uncharacterized protein LOC113826523 [Penaeus vannamei]